VTVSPLEEGVQVTPTVSLEKEMFGNGGKIIEVAAGMDRVFEGGAQKGHGKRIAKKKRAGKSGPLQKTSQGKGGENPERNH